MSQVLSAAVSELTRSGYDSFRVDHVASAAGVNKTSVYRRWPNKLALVAAALRARPTVVAEPPDHGTLRDDLIAALQRVVDYCASVEYRDTAALLHSKDPDIEPLLVDLRREYYERQATVVERAIARGELPDDTDAQYLVESLFVQAIAMTNRGHRAIARHEIERMVELMVRGAEHGGAAKR